MSDQIPLRIVTVSGSPQIGEFQAGDTVGVIKGGTGTSSLTQFREDLGINDLMLSSMDDVQPLIAPSVGNSLVWDGSFWGASAITGGGGGGVTDHGALTGLSDDDHPQYTLSSTNNALSSLVTSVETSTVALSSYVSTNEALWASATPASALDHGGLQGLGDDDHPQYTLSSTNNTLSSLVTSIETSTVALSSYISTNEALWASATPASTLDHGGLQGLSDNDHPQYALSSTYNSHATDASKHFTVGSIDHGSITGLSDDDHSQYSLVDGSRAFTGANITVSTCPVPAPVCYAQMDGDGTAAASETKFGAGVTPTTVQDSTGHITWDNTNKEFDISVAGTYHVMATLVLNVGTTTLTTIRVKNGATAKNTYVDHGTHAAEDPEEVTIQAAFTCAASDSITVTFQDDGATNINLMAGSSVTVRRLF